MNMQDENLSPTISRCVRSGGGEPESIDLREREIIEDHVLVKTEA
jgi:hypothetical protein